jgi:hypothetical protein
MLLALPGLRLSRGHKLASGALARQGNGVARGRAAGARHVEADVSIDAAPGLEASVDGVMKWLQAGSLVVKPAFIASTCNAPSLPKCVALHTGSKCSLRLSPSDSVCRRRSSRLPEAIILQVVRARCAQLIGAQVWCLQPQVVCQTRASPGPAQSVACQLTFKLM